MGVITDDFESYSTGSLPTEWGTTNGTSTWTVEAFDGSNTLRANPTGAGGGICVWDDLGATADCDVVFRTRTEGNASSAGILLRASGAVYGTSDYYQIWFSPGQDRVFLGKNVSTVWTALTDVAFVTAPSTWYWLRVKLAGTSIKIGAGTSKALAEASWIIETSDADLASGSTAAMFFYDVTTPGAGYFDDFELTSSALDAGYGTLTVTGVDPVTSYGVIVVPKSIDDTTAGVLQVEGYDPSVIVETATFGTLSITGNTPHVAAGMTVASGLGTLTVTGNTPAVSIGVPVNPGLGTLTVTGYNPVVTVTQSSTVDLNFKWKDDGGNVRSRLILEEDKIDHVNILSIGTNTHAQIDTHVADSTIHFVKPPVSEETTTYTAASSDEVVLCDATGGAFTVTMPTAVGKEGYIYRIKKTDSSANAVKVDGDGSEEIDGDADFDLLSQDEVITVISDNADWWII